MDYRILFDTEFFNRSVKHQLTDYWKEMKIVGDEDGTTIKVEFIEGNLESKIEYWTRNFPDKVLRVGYIV